MIEGAIFDGNRLTSSNHDSPTFTLTPTATFAWVPEKGSKTGNDSIQLPMYYSDDREKIIANVEFPTGNDGKEKWLQAGAVLFLNNHI